MNGQPMSKAAELDVLDRAIAELGPSSYLGPWLAQVRAEVAGMVRSDFFPNVSLAGARDAAASIVEHATVQAADIVAKAHRDTAAIRADAGRRLSLAAAASLAAGDALSRAARGLS